MTDTEAELIEECEWCGGPLDAGEEGHYKSADERFVHKVCYDQDGPPVVPVLDLTDDYPFEEQLPKQYNCGHYAQGPPRRLPEKCPGCGVGAP